MDNEEKANYRPISDLKSEEGAAELLDSPEMDPYVRLAMAVMQGSDTASQLEEIAKMPLEKRYVCRVASALKWAFADFDDLPVLADRETLSQEDMAQNPRSAAKSADPVLHALEGFAWG